MEHSRDPRRDASLEESRGLRRDAGLEESRRLRRDAGPGESGGLRRNAGPGYSRGRLRRDAGLAAVAGWTRRAVAGGVLLMGVLGAGLAHLLPGQAEPVRHDAPVPPPPLRPRST